MKKLIKSSTLVLFIALGFTACKKDSSSTNNTNTGLNATVTASGFGFDGTGSVAFNSTTAGIVKIGPILTITAIQNGTSNAIEIVLNNVTAAGTFSLDKDNTDGNGAILTKDNTKPTDGTLNYTTDATSGQNIGGGQVMITSLTSTDAQGTFYVTAYNSAGKAAFVEQGTFKGHVNTR